MSAMSKNQNHMSDNNQSGAPSAAPGAAKTGEVPGFGVFGANRGSGLARGKRATPPAAPAASAASSGYKPSSLEVITSKSEYVNPFTGETTVSAPPINEPAPQAAPTPAPAPVAPIAQAAPAAAYTAPAPIAPKPSAPAAELFPLDGPAASPAPVGKSELNILPTEEARRPAVSWEASTGTPAPQREERATFRTERDRRDDRPAEQREPRPFEPREPRRDERKFQPRGQPYHHYDDREEQREPTPRAEQAEPAKKTGGFFAWLKGLFGGKKTADAPATGGGAGRHEREELF